MEALEQYFHYAILDTVEATIEWASNMTFNNKNPIVHLVGKTYEKGVVVGKFDMKKFESFLDCSENLPKWDITISPVPT